MNALLGVFLLLEAKPRCQAYAWLPVWSQAGYGGGCGCLSWAPSLGPGRKPSCLMWPLAELTTTWAPECPIQADCLHPLEGSILETTDLPA